LFGHVGIRGKKREEIMNRRKMNRKQWVVMLIFLPTLMLGQIFLRQRFGLFQVSIGIGIIFMIISWLVRDRDTAPHGDEHTAE
jgi:hypothetical protein